MARTPVNFSSWLNEAVSINNIDKASFLIQQYLTRKVGTRFVRMLGVEHFNNSLEQGVGVRFFFGNGRAIRFNWGTGSGSADLSSVDIWDGNTHDPNWNMQFSNNDSLVAILPFIADALSGPIKIGTYDAIPADSLNEDVDDIFDAVVSLLKPGAAVPVSGVLSSFGSRGEKLLNYLRMNFASMFGKQGRTVIFTGSADDINAIKQQKGAIATRLGSASVHVRKGGSKDQVTNPLPPGVPDDNNIERVAYEDQIDDLKALVTLTINGASNALFVAGRGGIGKTYTVEETLERHGLKDGSGYFKQTGSASAAGLYKLLFMHRDDIILFDDADGALADQDGRNLIKAATDTKKARKLAWAKASKNLVDPESITDEMIEDGMMPSSYEFTGRIIFISNLPINKLDPDGALRTRALMISIDPTNEEVLNFMKKIVDDIPLDGGVKLSEGERQEVVAMMDATSTARELSIRKLVRSLNVRASAKAGGINNWQRLVKLYA